jgi:hypothetical protein
MKDNIQYFLVTSYGRTATYWIASILNKHPDIICNHGPSIIDESFDISNDNIPDSYTLEVHKNKNNFYKMTLDEVFNYIESKGNALAYGNVHGYAAHSIEKLKNNSKKIFRAINIVRHPVTRIESLYNRILYEAKFNYYFKNDFPEKYNTYVNPEVVDFLKNNYDVDIHSIKFQIFMFVLFLVVDHDSRDLDTNIYHIQMERITKDMEYFYWVFNYLFENSIIFDKNYYNTIMNINKKNVLKEEILSEFQFDLWEQWKKDIFIKLVDKNLYEKYNLINYSIPF